MVFVSWLARSAFLVTISGKRLGATAGKLDVLMLCILGTREPCTDAYLDVA
jgi:hypothetical protein